MVAEETVDMTPIPPDVSRYTDQSLSAIHHVLRASRRRLVIVLTANRMMVDPKTEGTGNRRAMEGQEGEIRISVRQLAREVVTIEEDIPLHQATGEPYHNVYTSLIQSHLPKLDDVDAVEYDADRKHITPGKNLPALTVIAATTSPTAQLLFHSAVLDMDPGRLDH